MHNRSLNILGSVWFQIEKICNYRTILVDMLCEKVQRNWLITADNCKQMLLLSLGKLNFDSKTDDLHRQHYKYNTVIP